MKIQKTISYTIYYYICFVIVVFSQFSCVATSELREAESLKKDNLSLAATMELSTIYIPGTSGYLFTREPATLPALGSAINLGYGLTDKLDAIVDLDIKQSSIGFKYQLIDGEKIDIGLGLSGQTNLAEYILDDRKEKVKFKYSNVVTSYVTINRKNYKLLFNLRYSGKLPSLSFGYKKEQKNKNSYALCLSIINQRPSIGFNYEFRFYDILKTNRKKKKQPYIDEFH